MSVSRSRIGTHKELEVRTYNQSFGKPNIFKKLDIFLYAFQKIHFLTTFEGSGEDPSCRKLNGMIWNGN